MRTSGLAAIHPGEFLAEILVRLGVSQAAFARAIGVSPIRVSYVIGGSRSVTGSWHYCSVRRSASLRNIGSICNPPMILQKRAALSAHD